MNPKYVRVLNCPWNGRDLVKLATAEFMVKMGRAEWVKLAGEHGIRMLLSDKRNTDAAAAAARGYQAASAPLFKSPDLSVMKANQPDRYKDNLLGGKQFGGRGRSALGRSAIDRTIQFNRE